jgi:hypothetical protein
MEQVNYNLIDDCLKINHQYIEKLPYHLNIIEELHSNENAHSRILAKLLQYKNQHGFVIYDSFLNFIVSRNQDKDFNKIKIHNPLITQEEERIDIWIRDNNYAIIIENKIFGAGDQNEQIKRYIDVTKGYHYDEKAIFVLYMPSFTRESSKQTWGNYKDSFNDRFAVVSFNEDVLEWLRNYVLPNVTIKEVYLRSAIEQYIDYLEGYSSRREQAQKKELLLLILNKIGIGQSATADEQYHRIMSLHRALEKVRSRCDEKLRLLKDIVINEFDRITKNYYQPKGMICEFKENYCCYQIKKHEWETKIMHFEWINFNQDSLFDSQKLTFVIHVEGDQEFQKTLTNIISHKLNEDNSSTNSYPTCYQKTYYIPDGKGSFAELSTDEKKSFLEGVYNNFMLFVDVIDKALKPVQNPNEKE